jgi:hypothetical protein
MIPLQCCLFQSCKDSWSDVRSGCLLPDGRPICNICITRQHVNVLVLRGAAWVGVACRSARHLVGWYWNVCHGLDEDVDGKTIIQHWYVAQMKMMFQ